MTRLVRYGVRLGRDQTATQWQGSSRCPTGHPRKRGDLCGGARRAATQAPCQPGERGFRRAVGAYCSRKNERWLAERIVSTGEADAAGHGTGRCKAVLRTAVDMSSPTRRPAAASSSAPSVLPPPSRNSLANIAYDMDRLIFQERSDATGRVRLKSPQTPRIDPAKRCVLSALDAPGCGYQTGFLRVASLFVGSTPLIMWPMSHTHSESVDAGCPHGLD